MNEDQLPPVQDIALQQALLDMGAEFDVINFEQ